MKCPSRILGVLAAFLLAVPAAVSLAQPAKEAVQPITKPLTGEKAPQIRARVNGTTISVEDVERGARALMQQNGIDPASAPADLRKRAEEAALGQLVAAEAMYLEGKKKEIKDLDGQVRERMEQNRNRFSSREDFEKALAANGLTEALLEDLTRKDIVINALINSEVMGKISVTDEQARKFYDENRENFTKPESVRASHILVGVEPNASEEEKKKAKEKAEGILKKLKGGADFEAIAKADSACPSGAQGGDLGEFGKGQMVPAFEEAAFALKPGELSGVVETQFGYHIIKVTEKTPAGEVPFAEVKDRIVDYLKQNETQQKLATYVDEVKKKTKIEILDAPKAEEKKGEVPAGEKKQEAAKPEAAPQAPEKKDAKKDKKK